MQRTSSLLQSTGEHRTVSFGGGATVSSITIQFQGNGQAISSDGLAAQELSASVKRRLTRLYNLGTTDYFMVPGYPSGEGSIKYLVGPAEAKTRHMIKNLANMCSESSIIITTKSCDNVTQTIEYVGGYLQGISTSVDNEEWVVWEEADFTFIDAVIS